MVHIKIYNVELTNYCNASCKYCPHPKMTRDKGLMSEKTFKKVLKKQELDFIEFHNFGDPLIHPKIFKFIKMAHDKGFKTQLSTNGMKLSEEVMGKLVDSGLDLIWISIREFYNDIIKNVEKIHEKYSKKIRIIIYYVDYPEKIKPIPKEWETVYIIPHSWAHQVDLPFLKKTDRCQNMKDKSVTVLWDGRVSNCCFDFDGKYIIGTIDDKNIEPKPNELCKRCEFGQE